MMPLVTMRRLAFASALTAALAAPAVAAAQAYTYPSFQQPRITAREYSIGAADAGTAGGALVLQWREATSERRQLSLDLGYAGRGRLPAIEAGGDGERLVFVGGQLALQEMTSSDRQPLDLLFTLGLNGSFGDRTTLLRAPLGFSLGHRFPIEGGMAFTPFVHPRASVDYVAYDVASGDRYSEYKMNVTLDLGGSLEVSEQLALRASATIGSSDIVAVNHDAFGISLAYTPRGPRR